MIVNRVNDSIIVPYDDVSDLTIVICQGLTRSVNKSIFDAIRSNSKDIINISCDELLFNIFFSRKNISIFVIKSTMSHIDLIKEFSGNFCLGVYMGDILQMLPTGHLSNILVSKVNNGIIVYNGSNKLLQLGVCDPN